MVTVALAAFFLGRAVIRTVRLAPFPPKTMLLFGTRLASEELALNVRRSPSASATVRFIVPLALPFTLPPAATATIGGVLTFSLTSVTLT